MKHAIKLLAGSILVALSQGSVAGTNVFFTPLTQSTAVATPNHINELSSPWQLPAGITYKSLLNLSKIEATPDQSIVRVPGLGTSASMLDMSAYSPNGRYLFLPHETPIGAGLTRYDTTKNVSTVLFAGDQQGAIGDWTNDYGAFDPARYTPNNTVLVAEEWSGLGRVVEVLNPFAAPDKIKKRVLESIANVSHEGINFSEKYSNVIYYIDEWNSGSIYKFVMTTPGDYTKGQTFALKVDAYTGTPADMWSDASNTGAIRTGMATWMPLTDENGTPLTTTSPFRDGDVSADPRTSLSTVVGGRAAADEVNATPYGRPEDMEVGTLKNGNEVFYVAVTSESAVYSFEVIDDMHVNVGVLANANTPKNVGYQGTTAVLNSPDNLAKDALGNIYVIEDAPNSSTTGGDIWFLRDTNTDGVAESMDHFMSLQVNGSEATGMIFNPAKPTQFVVSIQHPSSTDKAAVANGLGDAVWEFDVSKVTPPSCVSVVTKTCLTNPQTFMHLLKAAQK